MAAASHCSSIPPSPLASATGPVVADRIIAGARGIESGQRYDEHGICYLEFGATEVAKVDLTFLPGQLPLGHDW